MNKLVLPKTVGRIFNELDETDEQAPGVWSIDDESLKQNPCHLLLDGFHLGLGEQRQEST